MEDRGKLDFNAFALLTQTISYWRSYSVSCRECGQLWEVERPANDIQQATHPPPTSIQFCAPSDCINALQKSYKVMV